MNRLTIYICRDCGHVATLQQQEGFRRTLSQIECHEPGCLNWMNTQYTEDEHDAGLHYMPLGVSEDDIAYLVEILECIEWLGG